MIREIVLDTETTGLDPTRGDRLVEIGAVEIIGQVPTGSTFHRLVNPERDVPEGAVRVHGHTTKSLADKPVFAAIVKDFLAFIGDDALVIHNAEFDVRFLDAELARLEYPPLEPDRIVDTLALARRKHPGAPASLDALCDRYRIDRSRRIRHGALLDAEILVDVYVELTGGRQRSLAFGGPLEDARRMPATLAAKSGARARPQPLAPRLSDAERREHRRATSALGEHAAWLKYAYALDDEPAQES